MEFNNFNFNGMSIPEKIEKINNIILSFPDERKVDICDSCRAKYGDFRKFNLLSDCGMCSICQTCNEVINYGIIELVNIAGLSEQEYYLYVNQETGTRHSGERRTWNP